MNGRRFLRWGAGFVLVLLLLVGALFVPAVQKGLFVAIVSGPDREVAVEKLRVGLEGVRMEGLEFSGSGLLLRVPRLDLSLSWRALFGKRVEVRSLVAEGVYIGLPADPVGEEEPEDSSEEAFRLPEDFEGILPVVPAMRLDELRVEGLVFLPGQGEVGFRLEGQGIRPGEEGTLSLSVEPREGMDPAVPGLGLDATMVLAGVGGLESVAISGEVRSRVPEAEGALGFEASLVKTADGESYHCRISSDDLFAGGEVVVRGAWIDAEGILEGEISASGQNLEFLRTFVDEPLPGVSFAMSGTTRIEAGGTLREATLYLSAESEAGVVPGFDPAVLLAGQLVVSTDAEDGLILEKMDVSLRPTGESAEWFGLRLVGRSTLAMGSLADLPEEAFATLDIDLPAEFLESMVDGWRFSRLTGSWTLSGAGDGVVLQSPADWAVRVGRSGEGTPEAAVSFAPQVRYSSSRAEIEFPIEVSSSGGAFGLVLSGGADPSALEKVDFSLTADGELAALQPFADETSPSVSGQLRGDWSGSWTGLLSMAGELAGDGFQIGEGPSAAFDLRLASFEMDPSDGLRSGGVANLTWRSQGADSSIEDLAFAFVLPEGDGRPRLTVSEGAVRVDPASFVGWNSVASSADNGPADPPPGGLPDPDSFSFLQTPPILPLDLEQLALEIAYPIGERLWMLTVEVSDLIAGSEGSFAIQIRSDAPEPQTPVAGPSLSGTARVDSGGEISRVSVDTMIPSGWAGADLPDIFGKIRYTPLSPAESFAFSAATGGHDAPPLVAGTVEQRSSGVLLRVETDFANWTRTSLGRFVPNLSTGQMKASVGLSSVGVALDLSLDGVTPADAFESYELRMDGVVKSLNPLDLQSQVVLTDAKDKRSDLNLEGRGSREDGFELDLSGERIDQEALEGFARIWMPPSSGEGPAAAPEPTSPEPWPLADLDTPVSVSLSFREILLAPMPSFREAEGELSVNREKIFLRFSSGWMDGSRAGGEARAEWDGSRVDGSLTGNLKSVPVGDLLRKMNPGQTPALEGLFDLAFSFDGVSPDLAGLPDRMVGNLVLSGRDGVIRSLKPEARVTRMAEVGSLAGILLADTLNRPGVAALGEVADLFKMIPFDEMVFELNRTPEEATELPSIRLRGPYFSMEGKGRVEPSDLAGIPSTPMELNLVLGAKPPLLRPLQILDLLGTETDGNGFRLWKESIRLSGTFANPDTSALWGTVIGAVERAATLKSKDLKKEDEARGNGPGRIPEVPKKKERPEERLIEEGVNRLFNILGG